MQSVSVGTSVRIGTHSLSPAEQAAGVRPRLPFMDASGTPIDPDSVRMWLVAPTGTQRTFTYPAAGPGDAGPVSRQDVGRYYIDWIPDDPEDGKWRWMLEGVTPGILSKSDQDVFFVRRLIAGLP